MKTFRDLFLEHVGAALDRQLQLGDSIGPCDWDLDLQGGTVTFDLREGPLAVPIQVIGSEADAAAVFVPGWAIPGARMPERLGEASRRVRAIGEKERIGALTNARVPLEEVDGEKMSLVVCGALDAPGYFRAPFGGGAMFLLLQDEKLVTKPAQPGARVAEVFRRVVDLLSASEHRRALTAYLRHHGAKIEEERGSIVARWKVETLTAELGPDGAVAAIDVA